MAAFFQSSQAKVDFEVGEYQEFPPAEQKTPSTEKSSKPELRFCLLLLLFGLLCVLQAVLNVTLRLVKGPTDGQDVMQQQNCPPQWVEFNASCYYFSMRRNNWDDSRKECLRREADLVIVDDLWEQAFLTGFRAASWVGMTDRRKERYWVWVDGTPIDDNRVQWALGQPDDAYGGEDCGELRFMPNFIGLNDFNCSAILQWICEKKLKRG